MNVFELTASLKLKADEFYSALEQAGKVVADFVKEAVEVGSTFDASMSKVQAITGDFRGDIEDLIADAQKMGLSFQHGATDTETAFNILEAKALKSSAQTKFTAEETAQALTYMGMAGWKTSEMLAGLDGIMNLAAASGEDVGRVSDIVTDALTAFGKEASESGHLADVLAAAAANSNTNVHMLGESFKYAAPLAGALGYSFEDMGLALGLMANAGVKAGKAGRAINNWLTNLADPSPKALEALNTLGVSLSDAQGNMYSLRQVMVNLREAAGTIQGGLNTDRLGEYVRENFKDAAKTIGVEEELAGVVARINSGQTDIIGAFSELLDTFGDEVFDWQDQVDFLRTSGLFAENELEKVLALVNAMGGKQALPALLALINATDEEFNQLADAMDNASGSADKMSKTMLENLKGDITIFNSNLDILRKAVSDKVTPTLRDLTKFGTQAIQSITEAYNKGGLTNAMGQTFLEIRNMLPYINAVLFPEIERIGGTLIDTLTLILHNKDIKQTFENGLQIVFGFAEKALTENLDVITYFFTVGFKALLPIIKGALNGLGKAVEENLPDIIKFIDEAIPQIAAALEQAMPAIERALNVVLDYVRELLYRWYEGSWLQDFVKAVPLMGGNINDAILAALGHSTLSPEEMAAKMFGSAVGKASTAASPEEAATAIAEAFQIMEEGADNLYSMFENISVANDLTGWLQQMRSAAQTLTGQIDTVENATGGATDELESLREMIESIYEEDEDGNITLSITAVEALNTIDEVAAKLAALKDVYINIGAGGGSPVFQARSMSGGSILRGASLFGWDAMGRPQIGGDSGPEAVVGVGSLGRMIQESVRGAFGGVALDTSQPVTIQLVLDTGEIVSIVETEIANNVRWKAGGRA